MEEVFIPYIKLSFFFKMTPQCAAVFPFQHSSLSIAFNSTDLKKLTNATTCNKRKLENVQESDISKSLKTKLLETWYVLA